MLEEFDLDGASAGELVAFRIGDQEYCMDIMSVREIRGWTPATALPHAPHFVRGVINLRGAVLPIVDLRACFGYGSTETSSRHVIIVIQTEDQLVGLLVDAVLDILAVSEDAMQPTPDIASDTAQQFVKSVIAIDDRMLRYVEIKNILPSQVEVAA